MLLTVSRDIVWRRSKTYVYLKKMTQKQEFNCLKINFSLNCSVCHNSEGGLYKLKSFI